MSLFTPESRAACIARATRPIRGIKQPLRTRLEALREIRQYEEAHGLAPRNLQPLKVAYLHVVK